MSLKGVLTLKQLIRYNYDIDQILRLYAITAGEKDPAILCEAVQKAIDGGITCLQLREKDYAACKAILEDGRLQTLCREAGIPLIINDFVDLAVQYDADGVHIGQEDHDLRATRMEIKSTQILGMSCQTTVQAQEAEKYGASYIGSGAMFATDTKKEASVLPKEDLQAITTSVSIPVVAIGGIGPDNIYELAHTGVKGVSVISALFGSDDIRAAAQTLRHASDELFGGEEHA